MRSAGLFDLQVNGYAGVDFNTAGLTPDALDHALSAMLRSGVTHCLPTLITAAEAELAGRLRALDHAIRGSRLGPVMVPGIHLEGPFLNPAAGYAGCHPPAAMVPPDPALLERIMQGVETPIRLLTLAPEQNGGITLIEWASSQPKPTQGGALLGGALLGGAFLGGAFLGGIVTAMGHTAADHATVAHAAAAGLSLSTHLGNAMPQSQPKFLNPMIAQLAEDRLHASFIADGIHIPPHALRVLLRAKGLERSILITDATAAAAAPPGIYEVRGNAHRARRGRFGARARKHRAGGLGAAAGSGRAECRGMGPRRCGTGRSPWPRSGQRRYWAVPSISERWIGTAS